MPVDVQNSTSPNLAQIDRVEIQVPLRVKLVLKDGSIRTEDASHFLTRILRTLQKLQN